MALDTGDVVINRYRIVHLLGTGGFGAVYKAWDINLHKNCAIKENLDTSPEARDQFELEARMMAALAHQNLPRVTDHFVLPGKGQYLVMDYVEGRDLKEILEERGSAFPDAQVISWMEQILNALIYLHSRKQPVIHRDIKPANIRITPTGQAMLVDFGIAKIYDPGLSTRSGAKAITPGFSPPEQYGQGHTDARTDIYALGATMYCLLTGVTPVESIQRSLGTHLEDMQRLNPSISDRMASTVRHAMQILPEDRYKDCTRFKDALFGIGEGDSAGSSVPAGRVTFTQVPQNSGMAGAQAAAGGFGTSPAGPVDVPAFRPYPAKPKKGNRALRISLVVLALIFICAGFGWFIDQVSNTSSGAGTNPGVVINPSQTWTPIRTATPPVASTEIESELQFENEIATLTALAENGSGVIEEEEPLPTNTPDTSVKLVKMYDGQLVLEVPDNAHNGSSLDGPDLDTTDGEGPPDFIITLEDDQALLLSNPNGIALKPADQAGYQRDACEGLIYSSEVTTKVGQFVCTKTDQGHVAGFWYQQKVSGGFDLYELTFFWRTWNR